MSSVRLRSVTLEYPLYDANSRSLKDKLFRSFRIGGTLAADSQGIPKVIALRDITFDLKEGDRLAVLGDNGAGKSTLLRLLAGVYEPQFGEVQINGRVSTLFNVQLGVDPTATGHENIYICGLLNGLTRHKIDSLVDEIAEFSELGSFLNVPVRTYSQGMALRLAFAISTSIEPDILLLDEWIGAGDRNFLEKAQQRLRDLVGRSNLLVLATHRIHLVNKLCNKAILLDRGTVRAFGSAEEVLQQYIQEGTR